MAYSVKHKLGEGSYARVFLLCSNTDDSEYALKVIDKDRFSHDEGDKCVQEAKLMRKLRQENVCACFDAFEFEHHLLLVTEYCPSGDMYGYLGNCRDATPPQPVPEERVTDWVLQIAKALQYLHERKILHRDLKTKNIFLTEDLRVKIGDLGIAKQLDFTLAQAETFLGTPLYMCPEIFQFQPYSYKADIWSFGCCVYEMMTLRFAFESPSQQKMVQKILKGQVPNAPSTYSEKLGDLAMSMLHKDPQERPHAADVVQQLQPPSKADRPNSGNTTSSPRSRRRSAAERPNSGDMKSSPRSRRRSAAERPNSGDMKSSPRSRRRSALSRTNSSIDMPDLVSSLRSDRHVIVDSLMTYFQSCTASGLGNGFDINVLTSTKTGLSRTVKTIMTRCPSQEETTLFTRQFGTGLQGEGDTVDNVGYGDTPGVTVKRSPRKSDKSASLKKSVSETDDDFMNVYDDEYHDNQPTPDEVIRWAKKNLVSCQTPPETKIDPMKQPKSKQSSDSQGKTRKKKNFLKNASERKKSSSSSPSLTSADKTPSAQKLSSTTGGPKERRSPRDDGSKTVTLFTRSQRVVFQKTEFLAGDDIDQDLENSLGEPINLTTDIESSCEADLGPEMMKRAKQLVKIVKDKKLLHAQLQDLIGWRNYKKYSTYLCQSSN